MTVAATGACSDVSAVRLAPLTICCESAAFKSAAKASSSMTGPAAGIDAGATGSLGSAGEAGETIEAGVALLSAAEGTAGSGEVSVI